MRNSFNWKLIFFLIGLFLCVESGFMLLSSLVAWHYGGYDLPYFLYSAAVTLAVGAVLLKIGRRYSARNGKREGAVTITFVWLMLSLFGTLPFWWSGAVPSFTDAFFETISGFTTTGASVLTNIEALPHGLLFWRSLTQWIGGVGFVLLSMAILPFLNGDVQLFSAEATGPIQDKLQPRIKATARRLILLYLVLTALAMALLWLGGMGVFDAVCHSLTTLATGGYSTKQLSIDYWQSPFIHYVIIIFMFLGGTKFILLYLTFVKGQVRRLWRDEEFRAYLCIVLAATLIVAIFAFVQTAVSNVADVERVVRDSLFQVVATITTTGFCTYDYLLWHKTVWIVLGILMVMGASSGSTSGGMKLSRMVILFKNSYYEFKRRLHPNAYLPIKMGGHVISDNVINGTFSFFVIYLFLMALGALALSVVGVDLGDAFGMAISAVANIGPAWGEYGPTGTYLALPAVAKWILAFLMLVGRLELFTVLLLFSPTFWKR